LRFYYVACEEGRSTHYDGLNNWIEAQYIRNRFS